MNHHQQQEEYGNYTLALGVQTFYDGGADRKKANSIFAQKGFEVLCLEANVFCMF